jgi:uncharacterized protein (UPF0332 family)
MDKSRRKLQAAQKLLSDGFYEDAISRAYYAMYSAIRAKNISPLSHKGLFIKFSEHFVKTEIFPFEFARILAYAKEIRENGDYEPTYIGNELDARNVVADAEKLLQQIENYLKDNNILML